MEPHQELSVFLPGVQNGAYQKRNVRAEADFICLSVAKKARPRRITSILEYQDA